jgi:rhodanese-related sulfurtransferase
MEAECGVDSRTRRAQRDRRSPEGGNRREGAGSRYLSHTSGQEARIRTLAPISRLSLVDQEAVLSQGMFLTFSAGEIVYAQGREDNYANYLLEGSVEFLWNGRFVRHLDAEQSAIKRALDGPGAKRYTVRARTWSLILRIERTELERKLRLADLDPGTAEPEETDIAREQPSNWMIRMLQSQRFANLPPQNIQRVFERMERVDATANELIIRQGDPGGYYYVIEEGYCDVSREPASGGREIHLAELGPGDGFGEEALVSDRPRNASVTMRSNGVLMRLDKESFIELIRDPLISKISYQEARRMIDEGAVWIDVRHRDQFAKGAFRNARNIPRAVIRVECRKLVKGRKYIVCGEDPGDSAVAAFLLAERGYDVSHLDEPLSKLFASTEAPVQPAQAISEEANTESVVPFPPASVEVDGTDESEKSLIEKSMEDSTEPDEERPIIDLENGFGPSAPAPRDAYADTVTGERLADLVEEINDHFQELEGKIEQKEGDTLDEDALDIAGLDQEDIEPPQPEKKEKPPEPELPQDVRDIREFEINIPEEEMSQITRDMLLKLRRCVSAFASAQRLRYEEQLRSRTAQIEVAATKELHRKAEEIRLIYQEKFEAKELSLRRHYQRLVRLANKITRQKAELQQARKDLEQKLNATDSLYREVHDIRRMLTQRIGNLDGLDAEDDDNNQSAS